MSYLGIGEHLWRAEFLRNQLEKTYCSHRQGLFSLALSITCCRHRAEDAVQTAFERMCCSGVNPSGSLVNYVFAAVRNAAFDVIRADRRALKVRESLFDGGVPVARQSQMPADELVTQERDQILRVAVQELDDDDREVVVLKVFAGLTFDAIAEVLKQPSKTVATRYRRALLKLEDRLRGKL